MNTKGPLYNIVVAVLRVGLILALIAGVWDIYRRLPNDTRANPRAAHNQAAETSVQLILRDPGGGIRVPLNLQVQLYPVDVTAVQNEFFSERRPGKRLEDFLAQRMGTRAPVETRFDEKGQATVSVKPGPWWIHTTLPGELNIEWRLRVNVSGKNQTVVLTPDNAYTRTRTF